MMLKVATVLLLCSVAILAKPKNIIYILVDDMGYNDISWHNPDIISPNMEELARTGITLEQHYVQPVCTPTRAALLTGYYPIHSGRHIGVLLSQNPNGLYTNFTLLPERLNELGYRSHMVGKWHLGFCDEAYLPTRRGFLSFHGFYNGMEDYYNRSVYSDIYVPPGATILDEGYDFRRNDEVDYDHGDRYSTFLFADDAKQLIEDHALNHQEDPLFLYLAFNAVHAPSQAPDEYLEMYPNIENKNRKIISGQVTALDDAIGTVTQALKDNGMYEDTIIVFSADNGATPLQGGNNYPLRGVKSTLWEGGTRVVSFIHAPFLNNSGTVYNGLIHVTDWLPTLYSAAGGDVSSLGNIDGIDQWESIINSAPSKRTEMLYNIREVIEIYHTPGSAYRIGEMKLICGSSGIPDGWAEPDTVIEEENLFEKSLGGDMSRRLYSRAEGKGLTSSCLSGDLPVQLFNLTADPTEHFDVSMDHPDIVLQILERLQAYEDTMIPNFMDPNVEEGNPNNFGGVFTTGWCEAQPAVAK